MDVVLKFIPGLSLRRKILTLFLGVLVILSSYRLILTLTTQQYFEETLLENTQKRQLILARSAAGSIGLYLDSLEKQLLSLGQNGSISSLNNTQTHQVFNQLLIYYGDSPLTAFARIDKTGKLVVVTNTKDIREGEGESFSDRDYVKWATQPENKGKVFISKSFVSRAGETKGKRIVVLATPIYDKNEYSGLVTVVISVDKLTSIFVDPFRTSKTGSAFLANVEGDVISADERLINKNLFEHAKNETWQGSDDFAKKFENSLKQDEGVLVWNFKFAGEELQERVVSFKRVPKEGNDWVLFVDNKKDALEVELLSWVNIGNLSIFGSILATLFIGALFVLIDHVSFREGYEEGLNNQKKS